jgi:AcrR family transcriptional regulator
MEARIDGRSLRYQHRRGELLEAVADYVLEHGVAAVSLRRVAESVGVSHVTLQHHFGSKEQLVGEIVDKLLGQTLASQGTTIDGVPDYSEDLPTRVRRMWAHLTSPTGERGIRLFIEVVGQSLFGGAGYSPAVALSIDNRLELITKNLIDLGCPEDEAAAFATLLLATLRGLVIELLITGDRERLDQAFELAVANIELRAAEWPSAEAPRLQARRPRITG